MKATRVKSKVKPVATNAKVVAYKFVTRTGSLSEAACHFGGAFAFLTLIGHVTYDVALSTAALISASAMFDHRQNVRLDALEAHLANDARLVEGKEDKG